MKVLHDNGDGTCTETTYPDTPNVVFDTYTGTVFDIDFSCACTGNVIDIDFTEAL
jgi:hypothetical protein